MERAAAARLERILFNHRESALQLRSRKEALEAQEVRSVNQQPLNEMQKEMIRSEKEKVSIPL